MAPRTPSLVAHPRAAWPELSFADLGIGRSDWVTRAGPAESQAPLKAANFPAEEEDVGGQSTEKGTLLARRWREPHGKPERERNLHTSHCAQVSSLARGGPEPGNRVGPPTSKLSEGVRGCWCDLPYQQQNAHAHGHPRDAE